jgi:hypothetical protein
LDGVDVREELESRGVVQFHRGNVLCALTKTPAHVYWGHIGVNPGNSLYGTIFLKAGTVRLYKVEMSPTGNASIDRRWGFGFEGTRPYSFQHTLDETKAAADFISTACGELLTAEPSGEM